MIFGVTNVPAAYRSSSGRLFTAYRTRLSLRLWSAGRAQRLPTRAVWDTAADFVTLRHSDAVRFGVPLPQPPEALTTLGVGGSVAGVVTRVGFQIEELRGPAFITDCLVLPDEALPLTLLGTLFVRRNFNVETRGERRAYFRLRDPAPDAVPAARLRTP